MLYELVFLDFIYKVKRSQVLTDIANLQALQSVGQVIGEVLRQLDEDRFIVKASLGPRYVVGCRKKVDAAKLKSG
jgi:ATP-dependent 26S proteasome regulatory subunit